MQLHEHIVQFVRVEQTIAMVHLIVVLNDYVTIPKSYFDAKYAEQYQSMNITSSIFPTISHAKKRNHACKKEGKIIPRARITYVCSTVNYDLQQDINMYREHAQETVVLCFFLYVSEISNHSARGTVLSFFLLNILVESTSQEAIIDGAISADRLSSSIF